MPRLCPVFYRMGEATRFGFGQAQFPGIVPGRNGWRGWVCFPGKCAGEEVGRDILLCMKVFFLGF